MRRITLIFGTVASLTANSILAPCRMIPCFSTALPTMKPGTSCRNTSGMLNASHSHTKRAALSAAFTSSAPPSTIGWLATMPTGRPSMRASAVTRFFAHSGFIQSTSPSSTIALTTLRMSYARRGAVGTMS